MIEGDPENVDAQYRTEFSVKALKDAGMDVKCLDDEVGNCDQVTAQQLVANALSQYGEDIEVVFCNNDAMALGALQAIDAAVDFISGKTNDYYIGCDYVKVMQLKMGVLTFIRTFFYNSFRLIVASATEIINKEDIIGMEIRHNKTQEVSMSAFLGPIHFWLYHKIQLQQDMIEKIIAIGGEFSDRLRADLEERYGAAVEGTLEENIDQGNIHGWLQTAVSQVEYKLAGCVTFLLEKDPENLQKLKKVFQEKGEEEAALTSCSNVAEAYKVISDSLLDGMPCDHANAILEETNEKVIWLRNLCVHSQYWEEAHGNIDIYYMLRDEFIKGILTGSDFEYVKMDEVTSMIKKL